MATTPISDLQIKAVTSRTAEQLKWDWTRGGEFARGIAIAGNLTQYDCFGIISLVNICSRKYSGAKQNYNTYDRYPLAIVQNMKQWLHCLQGANHKIVIQCNHKNIEYFKMSKVLSQWQPRWAETFSFYDMVMEHLKGTVEPADGPSRRPDYEIGYEKMKIRLPSTLVATTITKSYGDLLLEIKRA